jgi:hypothetical protein
VRSRCGGRADPARVVTTPGGPVGGRSARHHT